MEALVLILPQTLLLLRSLSPSSSSSSSSSSSQRRSHRMFLRLASGLFLVSVMLAVWASLSLMSCCGLIHLVGSALRLKSKSIPFNHVGASASFGNRHAHFRQLHDFHHEQKYLEEQKQRPPNLIQLQQQIVPRHRRGVKCRGWFESLRDNMLNIGKKKVLVFRSAGALIPKRESQLKGGEDAFFMSRLGGEEGIGDTSLLMKHSADGYNKDKNSKMGFVLANLEAATVLGVADGVGSWSQYRIDPGQYSKQLMMNTARAALEISKKRLQDGSASELLVEGHKRTKLKGSTTTTIACLTRNTLSAATIGDTAFVLLRNGKIYFKSPTQEFEFDTPYQLADKEISDGFGEFSEPEDALLYTVRDIRPGDVLVMGTDGLFDNLHDYEIEQIVAEKREQGIGADGISKELIERARAHSLDPEYVSPWAQEKGQLESGFIGGTLKKLGIKAVFGAGYKGGKPDDISVITGVAQYLIPGTDLFLPI